MRAVGRIFINKKRQSTLGAKKNLRQNSNLFTNCTNRILFVHVHINIFVYTEQPILKNSGATRDGVKGL